MKLWVLRMSRTAFQAFHKKSPGHVNVDIGFNRSSYTQNIGAQKLGRACILTESES